MERQEQTARAVRGGALASALTLTALASLTACSASSDSGDGPDHVGLSSHSQPVSPAPPGRFQTLPEPCGTVGGATLHALLPNSPNYAGDAALTYDTDRRVGCKWSGSIAGGDRFLSIDFERVVSYNPAVSDEDRAAQNFEQMAQAAHIPPISPDSSASPSSAPPASPSSAPPASPSGASASPSTTAPADTSPRRIGGIGDEAYLDDHLVTQDANVHRDVTVVFRTANVLVTVVLSQWSTDKSVIPPGAELQLGAHGIAEQVVEKFD